MRILFPYLARWNSANYSRYHHLMKAFVRLGHQVTVLHPPSLVGAQETNFVEVDITTDDVELIEVPLPRWFWQSSLPLSKVLKKGAAGLAFAAWWRAQKMRHYDVIVVYNLPHIAFLPLNRNQVIVFDVADDLVAMIDHELPKFLVPLGRFLVSALFRYMMRAAHLTVSASYTLAATWNRAVAVVPNGVDLELISQVNGDHIRARYSRPLVTYVGAFEYFVDTDLMISLAARLPNVHFLFVGGGRALTSVQRKAREMHLVNVEFTGPVPYRNALEYMAAADVGMIPFRSVPVSQSASPLKLFEYTAFGKPVVCTPLEEIKLVAHEWVFWAHGVEQWVERLSYLLTPHAEVQERLRRGRQTVQTCYDWNKLAREYVMLIQRALNRQMLSTKG